MTLNESQLIDSCTRNLRIGNQNHDALEMQQWKQQLLIKNNEKLMNSADINNNDKINTSIYKSDSTQSIECKTPPNDGILLVPHLTEILRFIGSNYN